MEKNLDKNVKNIVRDIVEIDVQKDIQRYIVDFKFSKDDLSDIEIPEDIDGILDECFEKKQGAKKLKIIGWVTDIILLIVVIVPIVAIAKPKLFMNVDKVYPHLIRIHEFLTYENIVELIGTNESEKSRKDATPVIILNQDEVKAPKNVDEELDLIHSLANMLVKAERKWEGSAVTPDTIKKALDGVEYIQDDYDRIYFRSNLESWLEGDFSNAVEVHNKVWEILGGTVGEAYDLNDENISEIKEKYFK